MSGLVPGPLLTVRPSRGLVDEKFEMVVKKLPPGQEVTLYALHQSEDSDYWEAFGHYITDAQGAVSVAEDVSVGGSYLGMEPMGLLWSLRPVPGSRTGLRLRKMDVCSPMLVHISVHRGHISQGFREATPLACAVAKRWYMAPGVRRVEVREKGVKGTFFLPPGPGPFPGVLDMWGGGGGLVEYRSALLASHGFVSMAMEYLPLDKSGTNVGLTISYFENAFRIVQEHPLVAADRIALFGLSLGASVSIALAASSSDVHPRCCVCVNGGHIQSTDMLLKDTVNEIKKLTLKFPTDENNHAIWRNSILPIPDDPSQKMNVGKIKCPIMLIVGLDDQNWASAECAEDMERMMKEAGNSHLLTVLSYPEAGHLIEPPFTPLIRSSNFIVQTTREKVILLWGGQPKPHADAQEDSWRKTLQFLQTHLYQRHSAAIGSKL
ncbi:hypothetical protein SKAU_G00042410 [Synaphobranchus kaupii]|uniref:Uncharacterized protein n=1 Tax=Synaphobranchus kaupii TaxID=118154 RepID=A0A9Q1G1S9_SYNKA|nr:hypothetical protein SKAU_G00042410 [Synaphobranchus kaupii]